MKISLYVLPVFLLLNGCSDLTSDERDLLGRWEWNYSNAEYENSGFLELSKSRENAYRVEWANPTERIVEKSTELDGYWRLNNNEVCIATEWEELGLFGQVNIINENCRWLVSRVGDNQLKMTLITESTNKLIEVVRQN